MKKLFIAIFVLCMPLSTGAANRFIAFNDMEIGHKSDWFDYMKKIHEDKYDLLKKQHEDWGQYRDRNIRDWEANTDCSEEQKNQIFADQLERAVALHKQQIAQWEQLCEKQHKEALEIADKHKKELDTFLAPAKKAKGAMKESTPE